MSLYPLKGEDKQSCDDYFNKWSDEERAAFIARVKLNLLDEMKIDQDYYGKMDKNSRYYIDPTHKPYCEGGCVMSRSTAGDTSACCCSCWNIRKDFEQWFHARKVLMAHWSGIEIPERLKVNFWDVFMPYYAAGPKLVK